MFALQCVLEHVFACLVLCLEIDIPYFVHSFIIWRPFGFFQILAIINNYFMNINKQIFMYVFHHSVGRNFRVESPDFPWGELPDSLKGPHCFYISKGSLRASVAPLSSISVFSVMDIPQALEGTLGFNLHFPGV